MKEWLCGGVWLKRGFWRKDEEHKSRGRKMWEKEGEQARVEGWSGREKQAVAGQPAAPHFTQEIRNSSVRNLTHFTFTQAFRAGVY